MLNQTIRPAQMWMTVQEPRVSSYAPNSYLLLLSALDNGWLIEEVELLPSWDQHGFIYLVTLYLNTSSHSQQIILPKNPLVDKFLAEYIVESPVPPTSV